MLAAGAVLLLTGPVVLTGCAPSTRAPTGPDPLESPARRAEADAALAAATVAQMATPTAAHAESALATAARALAANRMAHATTLRAELRRVRPSPASSSTTPRPAMPPPIAPPPATVASARTALIQALHAAQDEASMLVISLPGYRAALLASIAACCATHAALLS
ncbi:MAG: hypothetical protein DLM61_00925 [Pseudonocardiales bacterium]|nr:MAG: hypothetical protein DLM61_00925 [Pseudonocardiales bacterium]